MRIFSKRVEGSSLPVIPNNCTFTPSDANWFGTETFVITTTDAQGGTTDHTITATVTDSDGGTGSDAVTLTVNAPPTAPSVSIAPDPAKTSDDLIATASGSSDPDGSGTVTYSYAWYENGSLSAVSTSAVFPKGSTTKHLTYKVVVTPNDGIGDGPTGQAEVTIDNSAPTLDTIEITAPDPLTTTSTLSCAATASDDDGDTLDISYAWSNGSTELDASSDDGDDSTLTLTTAASLAS